MANELRLDAGRRIRPSQGVIEDILAAVAVRLVAFAAYDFSAGAHLRALEANSSILQYVLVGTGSLLLNGRDSVRLEPRTLVIIPPGHSCMIIAENSRLSRAMRPLQHPFAVTDAQEAESSQLGSLDVALGRFTADMEGVPLFPQSSPVVALRLRAADGSDACIRMMLAEFRNGEPGMPGMTEALLKQIMVVLFRRALTVNAVWPTGSSACWIRRWRERSSRSSPTRRCRFRSKTSRAPRG